jgi:membrane protease YdiL (CAAX protease family)
VFLIVVLSLGLASLSLCAALGVAMEPAILLTAYVGLTGTALLITRWTGGPAAVRDLLRRLIRWRFGLGRWLVAVFALPALTIGVAAATGTLVAPPKGWLGEAGLYLFATLIFGALVLNVWEELGWAGFMQDRLAGRHGLLRAALLTAIPFGLVHVPLAFAPGWTPTSAAVTIGAVVVFAPFFRILIGMYYADTGSLLAVGVLHAAFNASGALGVIEGGWQHIPALIVLTVAVAVARRRPA